MTEVKRVIAAEQILDNLHLYLEEMLRTKEHPLLGKDEISMILLLTDLPRAEEHDGA